ncbi:UNVERIFIED_CONTAM: hypothetical protein Sradi_4546700 [Sesamum radiatum]|uniref:DUF659 domain-containing protein n=1 Tax=Sesamum radiatum TaxID=300843 RepID=A0AAW2NBQ5_SESRA
MKAPSYYEVRVKYLKKALEHTNNILKAREEDQAKYGCSLMADGWTDIKHRSLINFLVNSPNGTKFIWSVDAPSYSHMAHFIDLMFEDFFKISNLKKTSEEAVMINGYIYNRSSLLDMLQDFVAKRDMVRLAKIRFATCILTLKRFHTKKANLKKMFTSEKWTKSKWDIQLDRPLHATGYYLNPEFYYSNPSVEQDKEVMDVLFKCIERLIPSGEVQDKFIEELDILQKAEDFSGIPVVIRQRTTRAPENARVYEDDDLAWGDVARASGVDEDAYAFHPRLLNELKNTTSKASSSKTTKRASTFSKPTIKRFHRIEEKEEEKEVNFDYTDEEDLDCSSRAVTERIN